MDVKGCGELEIPMPLTAHPESHVNKAGGSEFFLPTLFFYVTWHIPLKESCLVISVSWESHFL